MTHTQPEKPSLPESKTQVIGVRVPVTDWHTFEIKCLENQLTMSDVLRQAINNFLNDTVGNDNPVLQ